MADRSAKDKARDAMMRRGKKEEADNSGYKWVIGIFIAVCVLSVVYVFLNPKKSFKDLPVINEE